MTDTRASTHTGLDALRALLEEPTRDPAARVRELIELRVAHMGQGELARDLMRFDRRFVESQARRAKVTADLRSAVEELGLANLEMVARSLAESDPADAAALFDLAEVRAALRARGLAERAAALEGELVERVGRVELDDRLLEEARERYAALATEEEDLELRHRILLLEETRGVLRQLSARATGRARGELRRMARRLGRAACDRVLAARLERLLGRRGAVALETFSLVLLVALLGMLVVQSVVPMSEATERTLLWVDVGICTWFVVEFAFKAVLAPARLSWMARHMVTDLVPAIPAALIFLNVPAVPVAEQTAWVRALRMLRVAYFARYIRALMPLLRLLRLLLFLVRGLDSLVHRFSPLLNRNLVFFEQGVAHTPRGGETLRELLFRALRREHVLLANLARERREPLLVERARDLATRMRAMPAVPMTRRRHGAGARDIPVEQAIERLHEMRPEELGEWLPRQDIRALDRVARVLNAPLVRSLPFVRRLRSPEPAADAESRVVDLGKRVADVLEGWRERALFFADLHGILTGPQILDRIATAMIQVSKRPAMRLLLFGLLFLVVRLIVGEGGKVGAFVERFLATPLLLLGGACLVVLSLGRWLKRLAGEAAETLERTAEAHFLGLLELLKQRQEPEDLGFLARRVFRLEMDPMQAEHALAAELEALRTGRTPAARPREMREEINRVALLYLHFLDGAILHRNDVKTTEQLLANLSLENIRRTHLGFTRKHMRRLRRLSLARGSILGGPYLWFRFITESVALEAAKRVIDYNRHCLTLTRRATAPRAQREAMEAWMQRRRAELRGRTPPQRQEMAAGEGYATTMFNALDFLSADPEREEHVERVFGEDVLELLRADREAMIREIFGTTRLDRLPRSKRSINFHAFYERHLSHGRVLLLPLLWLRLVARALRLATAKVVTIVQEILAPHKALARTGSGRAPFVVALRKIHRMKAPGLLEAMRMRVAFDPAYCGAAPYWTGWAGEVGPPEVEADMDFLCMKEREREELRQAAARQRALVEELHARIAALDPDWPCAFEHQRRLGERAVTIAYVTDAHGVRTLLGAEEWLDRELPRLESRETRPPGRRMRRLLEFVRRRGRAHPVDRLLRGPLAGRVVSRRGRRNWIREYAAGGPARDVVDAWIEVPSGRSPRERALEILAEVFSDHGVASRELTALRAIQTLSVLDVRNYRQLVFRLGGYERDGEDAGLAVALP